MSETWWGRERFEIGAVVSWRLGPLHLTARRTEREWNFAHSWGESEDTDPGWSVDRQAQFPEEGVELARFVFAATDEELELVPALADRPVITSPRIPLFVSPGEGTTLFVGSPLWVQVRAQGETLRELPIQRPSDTWFGPSTREGELCYAARTRAVLDADNLESLPLLARRSVTPVRIHNRASTPLQIERLKLPVPVLSLFATEAGRVWSETVVMERSESSEMAGVEVEAGPPEIVAGAKLLADPREEAGENIAIRAFSTVSAIFRSIGDDND